MRRRFFNNNIKNFDINDYLTIEALEDNLQVYFPHEDLMYGIDGLGWKKLIAGHYSPPINAGQTISFKGNVYSTIININSFTITKRCNLLGNCMSLTSNDIPHFYGLFRNCTTIVSISKDFLPATTLAEHCYYDMFYNCSSLTTAPELPATTLADSCYHSMFHNCSSLTTAPELPATTLADSCYGYMFQNCTKLNYIKMLATDISASYCLSRWVYGVASSGTFIKNPDATWEVYGDDGIPNGWKVVMDEEESNLKSFQVDYLGDVEEFYFEDGMTWGEWVDSEYNNGDYAVDEIDDSICKLVSGVPDGWIGDDYGYVLSSDIILEKTYYLMN